MFPDKKRQELFRTRSSSEIKKGRENNMNALFLSKQFAVRKCKMYRMTWVLKEFEIFMSFQLAFRDHVRGQTTGSHGDLCGCSELEFVPGQKRRQVVPETGVVKD